MQIDRIFEALASRPRREILAYLSKTELTTQELAERFAMTAPSISRHLSVLENAGLVSSERKGQRVLYRLNPDSLVNTLTGFAFEICPVGRPRCSVPARLSLRASCARRDPRRVPRSSCWCRDTEVRQRKHCSRSQARPQTRMRTF